MAHKSRDNKQTFCSNCGQPATGKFCTSCGSPLQRAECSACGARLEPGARFCQNCSRRVGRSDSSSALPWVAAAAAFLALLVVAVVAFRPSAAPPTALPTAFTSQGAATVPSTPREEADALFDRAMTAYEAGDSNQASFSGQMALNAYALLDQLDADAHFHIGLLHQITGDYQAIIARADSIDRLVPNHLFAPILRHRAGTLGGDRSLVERGYQEFDRRYQIEGQIQRWEYDVHRRLIENFRLEAEEAATSAR